MSNFQYNARLKEIIDGDTQVLMIDLGFYMWFTETIRLANVDTHEISFVSTDSREYKRGMEEKRFVEDWFEKAEVFSFSKDYNNMWPLVLVCNEYNSYGTYPRIIGEIKRKSDGEFINDRLLKEFNDIEYR